MVSRLGGGGGGMESRVRGRVMMKATAGIGIIRCDDDFDMEICHLNEVYIFSFFLFFVRRHVIVLPIMCLLSMLSRYSYPARIVIIVTIFR